MRQGRPSIVVLSIEELYSNVMKRPLESILSNSLAKLRITDGHRNFTTIENAPLTSHFDIVLSKKWSNLKVITAIYTRTEQRTTRPPLKFRPIINNGASSNVNSFDSRAPKKKETRKVIFSWTRPGSVFLQHSFHSPVSRLYSHL